MKIPFGSPAWRILARGLPAAHLIEGEALWGHIDSHDKCGSPADAPSLPRPPGKQKKTWRRLGPDPPSVSTLN